MIVRSILQLPEGRAAKRPTGPPISIPQPRTPDQERQAERYGPTFERLQRNLENNEVAFRADPTGIIPERTLVFETAAPIQNLARVAGEVGLDILAEVDTDPRADLPDGFAPPEGKDVIAPTLFATLPTLAALQAILSFWRGYEKGLDAPHGSAPWWKLFDNLIDLRVWGPQDRLTEASRDVLRSQIDGEAEGEVRVEIELWPAADASLRTQWRDSLVNFSSDLGGRLINQIVIEKPGYIYDALLFAIPADAVRAMIDNPYAPRSLATLEGVQFVLPQALPLLSSEDEGQESSQDFEPCDGDAPFHVALLDGVPASAHPALSGGVQIEDPLDLVRLSDVKSRVHATSMASLILRGDLVTDRSPLAGSRILSIPVLIDGTDEFDGVHASAPPDRLFIGVVNTALSHLLVGENPLGPDVFIINFSIGLPEQRFANRLSGLGRLLDWWSTEYGVLFVVSAGNIPDAIEIAETTVTSFESMTNEERRVLVDKALAERAYERTLLAPGEALNVLTVGALSTDLEPQTPPHSAFIVRLDEEGANEPSATSAIGPGPFRSVKPDLLAPGGVQEWRIVPATGDLMLLPVTQQRTGLNVAGANVSISAQQKARGSSCAAALVTRDLLRCVHALTDSDGPLRDIDLPRRDRALLGRVLSVHSAAWNTAARNRFESAKATLGSTKHQQARAHTAKAYGYGVLRPDRMDASPESGVTLVGLGSVRKDEAVVFDAPLPPSFSGIRSVRSLDVSLAWFSPTDPARRAYRLARLEAVPDEASGGSSDWNFFVKTDSASVDSNLTGRGTVWSRRLVTERKAAPAFGAEGVIPIRVQCRDAAQGGLNPDTDIRFAVAVSYVIEADTEADVQADVHDEVFACLKVRARTRV